MPIRPLVAAAIACSALLAAPSLGWAGEPCRTVAGPIDPAFATPGGCVPARSSKPAAAAKGWTTAPDGRRQWSDGVTSLSVSGYVRYDLQAGSRSAPSR